MKDKDYIQVGNFGQPQGLKGEIKINIFTSSLESFKILNSYFTEDKSALIFKKIKFVGKKIIACIEGCENRDDAFLLKGKYIFCLRKNFPNTKDNEYYILDLIGSRVVDLKKNIIGVVKDVKNFGAGDLIEINNSDNNFYIPMNDENLVSVNLDKKTIVIDPIKGLLD